VGRRDGVSWVTVMSIDALPPALDVPSLRGAVAPRRPRPRVTYRPGTLSGEQWRAQVGRVVETIRSGAVGKVVMARGEIAELDSEPDARDLLGRLAAEYETCWTFAVDGMVGATPELLVRRERGLLSSRVLAG